MWHDAVAMRACRQVPLPCHTGAKTGQPQPRGARVEADAVTVSLSFLASLSLADNRFHGELPAGVPLPPSLRILDLSGNAFSGAIPGSLFTVSSATASPAGYRRS